jgi:PPOX class probable F420-dependent enzyme
LPPDVAPWAAEALRTARVARLATVGADRSVRLVPICFAIVGDRLVSAVDHKPKRTGQLRRLDDITSTGTATVLVDHYDDDWTQLWWVRVRGRAEVHDAGDTSGEVVRDALCAKYPQYAARRPTGAAYSVSLDEVRYWRWE